MRIYLFFSTLLSLFISQLFAQSLWNEQGHIPSGSRVDWSNAGLLNNTPTMADHIFNVTDPVYDDNDDTNFDGEIDAALDDAKSVSGTSIIYFPAGTYNIDSTIFLHIDDNGSNIIFQGAGSDKTTLKFTVGNNKNCFKISGKQNSTIIYLDTGIPKGTNSISGNGISMLNVGNWIRLCEYSHGVYDDWAQHSIGQITQLASINGNSATMKDEASKNYSYGNNLRFWTIQPIKNVGIEKLKIYRNDVGYTETGEGSNILFSYAVNCWVKGVEAQYSCRHHVNVQYSSHILVSGSYFNNSRFNGNGGFGYGVVLNYSTTNCLIENNIFRKLRHAMIVPAGANCNVFSFNYSREQDWNYSSQGADLCLHGNFPYSNLFEENNIEFIKADNEHGVNGPYNSLVRNIVYDDVAERYFFITLYEAQNSNVLGCWIGNGGDSYGMPPLQLSGSTSSLDTDIYGFEYYENNIPYYPSTHNLTFFANAWNQRGLQDVSYFYSDRPNFLDVSYTTYSWPSCGPPVLSDDDITQSIPARGRWSHNVPKSYINDATQWPPQPLAVNISGPTWLDNYVYGTFTANPSGGSGTYVDYKWWSRNDEGTITPLTLTGGVEPNAPLPGLWNQVSSWDGISTVTPGYNWDFSLKCEVTDSEGNTATDIHSVIVGEPLLAASQQNGEMAISAVQAEFSLQGNYPNPFNPITTIRFGLPEAANVKLVVYSVTGAKVATLVDGYLSEGYHEARWNGLNQAGARVASGIYIYELTSGEKRFIKKMLLAK